jgi:hypothetical protein
MNQIGDKEARQRRQRNIISTSNNMKYILLGLKLTIHTKMSTAFLRCNRNPTPVY